MAIAKCESCRFYNMCKYREGVSQIQSVNIEVVNQSKNYSKKERQ